MKFRIMVACLLLGGCDLSSTMALITDSPSAQESKAIGMACRQSARALEDCFQVNPKAMRSGIVEGWMEMDDYMRTHNIEPTTPQYPLSPPELKEQSSVMEKPATNPTVAVPLVSGTDRSRWTPSSSQSSFGGSELPNTIHVGRGAESTRVIASAQGSETAPDASATEPARARWYPPKTGSSGAEQ